MSSNIGVIIPVDTEENIKKIELALFSLLGQTVSPETVYLVCSESLKESFYLNEIRYFYTFQSSFELNFIYDTSGKEIHRLLNIGLKNVREKYITIAIAGEVLYPNAYELLLNKIRPDIGIVFSKIVRKQIEDCNGEFYAINLFEGKNFTPEFWEDYYYNKVGYISFLLNRELIERKSLYFSEEISLQVTLTKFLLRISKNLKKNVESFNICIGEKWIFDKDELRFQKNHESYQERMDEVEKTCFFDPLIKKEKKSLYNKIIPFMKYLRYHFFMTK